MARGTERDTGRGPDLRARASFKDDSARARQRVEAWWSGEVLDRAPLLVTAPRAGASACDGSEPEDLHRYFTDPAVVLPRLRRQLETTWWGGEALPVVFPVSVSLVAILSKFLGAPNRYLTRHTAWSGPIIDDWKKRRPLRMDEDGEWVRIARRLLEAAVEWALAEGLDCAIGLPDLNGPTEILAELRGAERLALDFYDSPQEIGPALEEISAAWLSCWRSLGAICHRLGGWFFWMRIWSDRPAIDLQSDVSCLLSREHFDAHFLPSIEQQTRWVERTVYHLDGPGAIRHLDSLLALPRLTAIQWVPGAGAAPASAWIPLCRRILAAGKRLTLACGPHEVEGLLRELGPEGVLLSTECSCEEEGRELVARLPGWTRRGS